MPTSMGQLHTTKLDFFNRLIVADEPEVALVGDLMRILFEEDWRVLCSSFAEQALPKVHSNFSIDIPKKV